MEFCPKCNTDLDVTRSITVQKGGVDYQEKIKNILGNTSTDTESVSDIDISALKMDPSYKKLSTKQKEKLMNRILETTSTTEKKMSDAFFLCKNCGYNEPIKPTTLIYKKTSNDIQSDRAVTNYEDFAYSDILNHTRNYVCSNPDCPSHEDIGLREAKIFRTNKSYRVKYICMACHTIL